MIVTLKDGSKKEYAEAKSVIDIAYDISEGLARAACAGEVNGEVVDLRTVIDSDCELNILTAKDEKRTCSSPPYSIPRTCPGSTDLIPGCKGCYRTFY